MSDDDLKGFEIDDIIIEEGNNIIEGTIYFLPKRKENETDEEYFRRCTVIKNIGKTMLKNDRDNKKEQTET